MFVPPAFKKLCGCFHQDVGLDGSMPEEWIAFARRHLSENEKIIVKQFLVELLNGSQDSAQLQRVWFGSGAEIYFPDDQHLRSFLTLIRDMLQEP